MKVKTFIKSSMWLMAAGLLTACASEDTQQKDGTKQSETKYVATFTGHQPNSNSSAKSRTTATHTLGNPAQVIWEATDRIWVKADDGRFYQSEAANFAASATPADHSRANFRLSQGYYATTTPEVRYVGTSTNADRVTIATTQTQASPNDFSHLGAAGDCGTATAHSGALEAGDYEFTLQHKASYLCFVPRCMNTQLGPNVKLTKIVVTADKPIAGTYDFSDGSLMGKTPTGGSNTITLNVGGVNDFSLNTTTENLAMNGAYMVLTPGTYNLTITYTMQDVNGTSLDFTKTETGFICPEGQIKDMKANLTPTNSLKYYMWDAQQDYWWGCDDYNPLHQPPYRDPQRWFNTGGTGTSTSPVRYDAQTALFQTFPNANELWWYVTKGDPHWDATGGGSNVIVDGAHLQAFTTGGLWLRKKSAIVAYLKAHEGYPATLTWEAMKEGYGGPGTAAAPIASPTDYRAIMGLLKNTNIKPSRPSDSEITDYFFLPAYGMYSSGMLGGFGSYGAYWSSSSNPEFGGGQAYYLSFLYNEVAVTINTRGYGFPGRAFE